MPDVRDDGARVSAWDKLLARVPMRMRPTLRDGDGGVVIRALCTIIDEQEQVIAALLKAATDDGIGGAMLAQFKSEDKEG